MSWARGPAAHSGAKHQVASLSECYNLLSSAVLAVEVETCQVNTNGSQLDAQQLKEAKQAEHVNLAQQEQLALQAIYAQREG